MSVEVRCHLGFSILGRGQIEGFGNESSGLIRLNRCFERVPYRLPLVIGQQVCLPLAVEERTGLTPETFGHMPIVYTACPSDLLTAMDMNPHEGDHLGGAQKTDDAVMVEV